MERITIKIGNKRLDDVAKQLFALNDDFATFIACIAMTEYHSVMAKKGKGFAITKKHYRQKEYFLSKAIAYVHKYNETATERIETWWSLDEMNCYFVSIKIPKYNSIKYHLLEKLPEVTLKRRDFSKTVNRNVLKEIVFNEFGDRIDIAEAEPKKKEPVIEEPKKRYNIDFDADEWLLRPHTDIPKKYKEKEHKEPSCSTTARIVTNVTSEMSQQEKFNERFARFKRNK